ncbi:MAG: alpha-L-glutamate ligase [Anaerolineae bacterium]|nr:alpha-L-glutamate ligase [Anaerolineae bacterium]
MNRNIQALIAACDRMGIPYQSHHKTNNLISVEVNGRSYPFVNWTTPLNPQSVMKLCQDKDYFYSFYHDVIQMPQTISFLNPYSDDKYAHYLESATIFGVIEQVEATFTYPVIVKKNRGSWGSNVFKVDNRRSLEKALLDVFNMNSSKFDFVGLAQRFIDIETEYRVLYLNGIYQFAYEKIVGEAAFTGNLSPLHWEGSKAQYVDDALFIEALKSFCAPMFDKLMIPFCGLDIAQDKQGKLWLIEANSSPGFDHIIKHEGDERVVQLYESILTQLGS